MVPSGLFVFARAAKKSNAKRRARDSEGLMEIDFDKMQGLAPAVIQDAESGELLMVGFMNRKALDWTLRTGFVTFYSRTRQKLWTKGESSGNRLQVVAGWTDCDRDTVLFRVRVLGEGVVCHHGTRSCFTQELPLRTGLHGEGMERSER
ncbi:MAG: phosphoribosyl-AMP cyclohydrolase [Terriglobales bacterium]|jgi:phosphoribosyl-ATP pyrophosphohydrolase/phosphoribosyl-AMP cyclohydrolase